MIFKRFSKVVYLLLDSGRVPNNQIVRVEQSIRQIIQTVAWYDFHSFAQRDLCVVNLTVMTGIKGTKQDLVMSKSNVYRPAEEVLLKWLNSHRKVIHKNTTFVLIVVTRFTIIEGSSTSI